MHHTTGQLLDNDTVHLHRRMTVHICFRLAGMYHSSPEPLCSVGSGRFGSNSGIGYNSAGNGRQQPYGRGQLYEPPQHAHRQTGGYGGRGRIQQPSQPQQNYRHGYDGHAPQQHSGEQHQGHFGGQGRGPPRGRYAGRGRGRGF